MKNQISFIEVIVTSGNLNILEIHRRIGISEVWFYQDGLLTIYSLKNEQYIQLNQSELLPELNLYQVRLNNYSKFFRKDAKTQRKTPGFIISYYLNLILESLTKYINYHDQYDAFTEFLENFILNFSEKSFSKYKISLASPLL
ncbi:hypothetical protein [Geminocystis sp. GBBB08]|uniref:hypothetical protein n=1 Tax=Geminocystis sp. GBBB08 TaxID=2604140 RepID=UPI0027E26922|nr:hypothetical protein [Geminocystis sp. GBBB08]